MTTVPGSHFASYTEIGDTLREAREDLRLTIQDAANDLHIRHIYLHALEEGRLDALPGVAYAKGYLQRYAAYLHLDKDEVIKRFERTSDAINKRGYFVPEGETEEKTPSNHAVWGGLAAALGLYAVWWLFAAAGGKDAVSVVDMNWHKLPVIKKVINLNNLPCAGKEIVLYPPCHMTGQAPVRLLPKGPVKSVMDLAIHQE